MTLPLPGPTDILPVQVEKYENLSPPSSRDKSSETLNTQESSSPENSDSSKISLESLGEKSGSPSSDLDVGEEKPSVLLKPLPKEKLTFLNLNKKKREFPAQKNAEQQDIDVRDTIITISENPNEVGENSRLLSNIRKPVKRAPEKKEDLTKDWEKLGTSEDELTFKRESGNLTDDPDSISFEGDIGVSKKNVLALKNSQALDEKSKKHKLQRVVLEGSGSDEWSFELISDQKGRSDYKGKELRSYPINGDEPILLENEEKSWPKLIPDFFKSPAVSIEKKDVIFNIKISLENEGSDEDHRQFNLNKFLNELSEEDRANLLYVKKQVLDEEYTKAQWGAIGVGVFISLLTTIGMNPIYSEGLFYLDERYKWNWIISLEDDGVLANILTAAIVLTILPDTLGRIPHLLKKAITCVAEKGIQIGRTLRTALSSLLPSMIPPFFLVKLELHDMKVTNTRGLGNQFAIAMLLFGPALFFDAWIANFDMHWEMEDDLIEWGKTSDYLLSRFLSPHSLHSRMPSEEEHIRHDFSKKFDTLLHTFPKMAERRRDEIYEAVFNARETIKQDLPGLEEPDLDIAELFFVTRYLLACSEEGEKIKKTVNSWSRDAFIFGTVASASFMGTLVLQVMGDVLLQLVTSRQASNIGGWVFAACGLYPLAAFEYMGMKNFFKKFLSHESKIEQALSTVVGAAFTVPLGVLSLQACDKWWEDNLWMIAAIPFLFAQFLTLSTLFCDSYHQIGTSLMKFYNQVPRKKLGYGPTSNYKTNYITERIKGLQNRLQYFGDIMLHWLQKRLEKADYAENSEL
ncbi:MAG: hypothetical protein H0X26_09750 [Alphaproteobacteria bacterium]|nr:hypothetical protein [Alphaproteobacteria bacterium]